MAKQGWALSLAPLLLVLATALQSIQLSHAQASVDIAVNFDVEQDLPLFKKYAVMNSGLVESSRYNDTIIDSFGLIRASAFVTDLYMGTSNQNASFGTAVNGALDSAGSNGFVYNFTTMDHVATGLAASGVTPYWAVTYAPTPFQPANISNEATQLAQCLGFQDVPGRYQCRPQIGASNSAAGFDDCWKCPPKDADGIGYTEYGQMLQIMAANQASLNITVYKQIWNEPDLTDYFNYSAGGVSFFHGTNSDYNQMYEAASTAMATVDEDLVVGGPGLAYWLQTNPALYPDDQRTSGTYFVQQVSNSSLPLDFFSFHAIAACGDYDCNEDTNGGEATFISRAETSRYVLADPPAGVDIDIDRFNTTEIHCTEYFAGTAAAQYTTPFTASTNLSVLMLNNFLSFLDQTDVTQVTWAQYMDIVCCDGQGLLDYYGNARPAWHSFKFWGDIPTERVLTNISNPDVIAVAGFSPRTCHGGVLVWNNGSLDYTTTVNISNIPYSDFTVQAYVLDPTHLPGPGFSLDPVATYTSQTATAGMWSFPPPGVTPFDLSTAGVLYLNITGSSCAATSPAPDGRVIKTHHYFSKRPFQTYMYGEFDTLKWAAYIGMGNETVGTALAGATVIVDPATVFNITMTFNNIAPPPATPAMGMRVDFWDPTTSSYPANSSIFFYQTGTQPGAQVPPLYGSKADVPAANFFYVNLTSFIFDPSDSGYPTPPAWDGKLSIIFMLQDGAAFSSAVAYITQASVQPASATTALTAG